MEIISLIVFGIVICIILWAFTASIGFPLGLIVGVVVLATAYVGYILLFASAATLIDAVIPK
jgi:hypothetical protein